MKVFDFYTKDDYTSIFLRYYIQTSIGSIRLAIWIAVLVISGFALLDLYAAPLSSITIILIRFGFILPVLLVTFILTFHNNFGRFSQIILFLVGLLIGIAFVAVSHIIQKSELASNFYFTNIIFWILWVHTLLRLKAELAMIVSGLIIICFNIDALLLRPWPADATSFNTILTIDSYLMATYLLGIWSSNLTERLLWKDFEQVNIIRHEKKTIEESRRQLVELNNLKAKLLSILSHDVRGPISSIKGILALYNEGHISQDDIKRTLLTLGKTIDGTSHMIDNLLSWSLTQLESREILKKNVSLRKLVDNVFRVLKADAERKGIDLINSIDEHFMGTVEPTMIELVVRNLVANSVKFTAKGNIEVKAQRNEELIKVSVEDTGIGIPGEIADRLFNWNKRSSENGTNAETGSGLGLLICRELIEKHGGTLFFDATQPIGATFHFTLPAGRNELSERQLAHQ
jgi:signal transduction histidine kinase